MPGLVRPIGIIRRKGKPLTPAVDRFIEVLQRADEPGVPAGEA
jgi:hypothetical protein